MWISNGLVQAPPLRLFTTCNLKSRHFEPMIQPTMEWSVPLIRKRPHQPITFHFPQREFGQKTVIKRLFQAKQLFKWPWLHYNEDNDSAYCLHCIRVYSQNKLLGCQTQRKLIFQLDSPTGRKLPQDLLHMKLAYATKMPSLKWLPFLLLRVILENAFQSSIRK